MQRRVVMVRMLTLSAVILVTAGAAGGQSVFRAAPTYPLPGESGLATSLFALADVGSLDGPLDGQLDVVAAELNQIVAVQYGNGDGTFAAGQNTDVGRVPAAMAVADFNGDHIPDLLIGDASNTVAFFKGTASADLPPFVAQGAPIAAGTDPTAIAAADVNGDGKLDAIVVDAGSNLGGVTILLGQGNGSFMPFGDTFPAGVDSVAVAVADFNGDGKLDLAVVNQSSSEKRCQADVSVTCTNKCDCPNQTDCANIGSVTIMRGAGTGAFTTVQTVAVGVEPVAIAARDLNGDGRIDLVVTNRISDNIAVINGLAGGSFATARYFASGSAGNAPIGLALADVNHDGAVDALVPNNFSSDVSVLLGDNHGNFAAPRAFVADQQPLAVATGDVNSDGVTDVVSVNQGTASADVAVLISRGDGALDGVEDVVSLPNPSSVVAGDVDNDGVADLIVAQPSQGICGGLACSVSTPPQRCTVDADCTGNTGPCVNNSATILVYRAQPPAGFAAPLSLQSAGDAAAVGQGDFNGDGRLDIAVVNGSTNNVSVFLGQVAGGFSAAHNYPIGAGARALAVGDWNHDGRSDLAVVEQGSGPAGVVEILLAAANGSFPAPTQYPVGVNPVLIDSGRFDNGGALDLAVANRGSGDIWTFKGNGDGTFTKMTVIPNVKSMTALAVADFDADHYDDLAVLVGTGTIQFYFADGQGGFTAAASSVGVEAASALTARDINGDALPDLLVAEGGQQNAVATFVNRGTRRGFSQDDVSSVGRMPLSVAAADFDGDGRYDGASADDSAGAVSVLTNILCSAESGEPCTTPLPVLRGDGNGDTVVSAADTVAVMRELGDGSGTRIEAVKLGGTFAAAPGVDANGDGFVTGQDALAVAHRLFQES